MKLKNKIAIISATAMLALGGVGFAAWVFQNQATANAAASNEITAAVNLDSLTMNVAGIKLVLDQTAHANNLQGQGIHWTDNAGNTITSVTLTPAITYRNGSDAPTYEYTFTPSVVASAGVSTYVTLSSIDSTPRTGTFDHGDTLAAFSYTLPTLAYVDEPDTLAEYDAMVSGMAGQTVTFNFTLSIADNVA